MTKAKMTYGQLDKFLRSLGFSVRINDGNARVYEHAESGARQTLPRFPDREKVQPHHLVAVHMTLKYFGIPEPDSFAAVVPRAD